MTQQLRELTDFLEDLSSIPTTHVGQITTACNSGYLLASVSTMWVPLYTCTYIHTQIKLILRKQKQGLVRWLSGSEQ